MKINQIVPIVLIVIFLIHFLSFEAREHFSYAFLDTATSNHWIKYILAGGSWGYQPGLAIYLSALYGVLDPSASLDYLGFAIGLVFFLLTIALLESIKKYAGLFFIPLYTLPYFLENQKFLIGLSNNQFFIILIPLILYLIFKCKENSSNQKYVLFLLNVILLTLTIITPALSLYVGYILITLLVLLPLAFAYPLKNLIFIFVAYLLGIGLYLLNLKYSPSQVINFSTGLIDQTVQTDPSKQDVSSTEFLIRELFSVKVLLNPFESIFNFAGYLAIILIIAFFVYGILNNNLLISIFSISGIITGVSTLTGIGQHSFVIGRSGWYYSLIVVIITALGTTIFAERYKLRRLFTFFTILLIVYNSTIPPVEYRYDNENIHMMTYILLQESNEKINLYSTLKNNDIYRFYQQEVELINNLGDHLINCQRVVCSPTVVIIDKNKSLPDPILSREIPKKKLNDQVFVGDFYTERENILKSNLQLELSLIYLGFEIYYDDESTSILMRSS